MTVGAGDGRPERTRMPSLATSTTPLRTWLPVGALLGALAVLWSLGTPLMASPDEPSHAIKAAAVVRGQLAGELGDAPEDETQPGVPTYVTVPSDIAAATTLPDCFRFDDEISAGCQPTVPARTADAVRTATYAGQYPPLYYAVVGWPSLFLTGEAALYGMRLASALVGAAMLTWGLVPLARQPRLLWGAVVGITPMATYMAGMINPNGLEIAAGFAFWTACLSLVRDEVRTSTAVQATVAGAVLVTVRTSGPVWALLIVGLCALAARSGALRPALRTPQFRWAAAGAGAAGAVAVLWILTHGEVVSTTGLHPELGAPRLVAAAMLLSTGMFFEQMIGNFGWLDTAAPYPTVLAWVGATTALLLVAVAARQRRRDLWAVLLAGASVVALPVVLTIPTAAATGLIWQGRYVLPLAIGVPVLAAWLTLGVTGQGATLLDRMGGATWAVLVPAHLAAYYWAVRRYTTGVDGPWVTLSPEWQPPVSPLLLVAGCGAALLGLAWYANRAATAAAERGAAPLGWDAAERGAAPLG